MTAPRVYKVEGIILKRKNVGEADRIITIFTKEYGKLRVIAKGVRKVTSRRAPHLEAFTRVSMIIHSGKTLDRTGEVVPVTSFPHLRSDLKRVSLGYYLCELIDSLLPEKQEHRDVFMLLARVLTELDGKATRDIYRRAKVFTLELLWALGYLPKGRSMEAGNLQSFIEGLTERRLKSTHFARQLMRQQ